MTLRRLVLRSLAYYWRSHVAVIIGIATAVAVLSGALLVGDSVRGSLRALALERLGRADVALLSSGYFRSALADAVRADDRFAASFDEVAPLVIAQGFVTGQESGRRVGRVLVYGVDDRFWAFHGVMNVQGPTDQEALLSPALASELAVGEGDAILVRVQRPSDVPLESLHGRKEDLGRTMRATVARVLPAASAGEFSLQPQQGEVRAVFVSLARMQTDLEVGDRVNALIASGPRTGEGAGGALREALAALIRSHTTLDDQGLGVRAVADGRLMAIEGRAGLLTARQAEAAAGAVAQVGTAARPVFTYLADTIRSGMREVPYSLVTALDLDELGIPLEPAVSEAPPLVLTDWAARDLQAAVGAPVTLEYLVWEEPGRLVPRQAGFVVSGIVPVDRGDRDLAPVYPGITDSPTLDDWDPPFPLDLRRVRPEDEAFWQTYRTTPKAFIPLEVGQRLWASRYGALTSIRVEPPPGAGQDALQRSLEDALRAGLDPFADGMAVRAVREEALDASRGSTDFGLYFTYFSAFLVVSALLLASLFFRLGIEQRAREVGLLRAVGFRSVLVRRVLTLEGLVLALAGGLLGTAGAVGYAAAIMYALRTRWVGAVGTTDLQVHVTPLSLVLGGACGVGAAVLWTWWTLRALGRVSERQLLTGELARVHAQGEAAAPGAVWRHAAVALAVAALGLVAAAFAGLLAPAGAFFGAGSALLISAMAAFAHVCRRPAGRLIGHGAAPISSLGLRSATYRPARSALSMAVIGAATFILISVDAFRREDVTLGDDPRSGLGGYEIQVDSLLPVVYDLSTEAGREALTLTSLGPATVEPFRVLPGDDASCLNLYEPLQPRILGVRDAFASQGRFDFQASLASTEEERANPWLLLRRIEPDGAVPVIADANSLTYVLKRRLGDDIVVDGGSGPVTLRVVAVLRDSLFQSELLMSEAQFQRLYPEHEGYRFLLVDVPADRIDATLAELENALTDFGADASLTAERLAEFHRVENTYLSTFQTLGGLGLLLGTIGMAAVLMRNLLERRRELALLGAVGYRPRHFLLMVLAENALLVGGGLAAGTVSALLAISPAALERGSRMPLTAGGVLLLFGVVLTAALSSVLATRVALRGPLVEALRSD